MKGLTLSLTSLLVVMMAWGCQKSPVNGDLDGMWEVVEVSPQPTENVIGERLYYNFQLHTCGLTFYGGYFTNGNMVVDGNLLMLDFPNAHAEYETRALKEYGIDMNPVVFKVSSLSKTRLVLENGETTVMLRKF